MDVVFLGLIPASGAVGAADHLFFFLKKMMYEGKQSENLTGGRTTENKQLLFEEQTRCLLSRTQSASGCRGQLLEQATVKLSVDISFSPPHCKNGMNVQSYFAGSDASMSGSPVGKRDPTPQRQSSSEAESRKRFMCAAAPNPSEDNAAPLGR